MPARRSLPAIRVAGGAGKSAIDAQRHPEQAVGESKDLIQNPQLTRSVILSEP